MKKLFRLLLMNLNKTFIYAFNIGRILTVLILNTVSTKTIINFDYIKALTK